MSTVRDPSPPPRADDTPMFGRAGEAARLRALIDGRRGPPAPGALLVGDAGMGKTRLLIESCGGRHDVLMARARLGDRLVPYATLARLLRKLQVQAPQLMGLIPEAERTALLPEWAGRGTPADPSSAPRPPRLKTLRALLRPGASGLRAWTLDDLQWADDASLELLLGFIVNAQRPQLPWVLASEPPAAGSVAEALLEAAAGVPAVEVLRLQGLPADVVSVWLQSRMAVRGPTAETLERERAWTPSLVEQTAGQPLHLELLLAWRPGPFAAPPAPGRQDLPELLTLIGQRLAEAGPAALDVARAASVAGQDVCQPLLAHLCPLEDAALAGALNELRTLGLWAGADFAHARMREAARRATPEPLARTLHARCAAWLESTGGEPGRIAAHWQAAGDDARGLPAVLQAAERARQLHCTADRLALLMRAAGQAEAQGQPDLAFDCCSQAFESHTESVRRTEGRALLAQMARLARTPSQRSRAASHQAWHALVHGQLEVALEQGEQALALADQLGDESLRGPARQTLGTALGIAGRLTRGLALLEAAQPWAVSNLPEAEQATFHGNLASVLDNLGRGAEAREHHRAALALADRQEAAPRHRATLLGNLALSRLDAGDPAGAREAAHQALDLLDGDEHSALAGFLAVLLAPAERTLGRYATALRWCDAAEEHLAARHPSRMPVALLQRAHVWMDLGQHERALAVLDGTGRLMARQLPARHAVRWLLLLARARTRCGLDPADALQEARDSLPEEGWPELPLLLQQECALTMKGAQAATELVRIAAEARDSGLPGVALGAWLQCALLAAVGVRQPALAGEAAREALVLLDAGAESTHVDRALRWLAPAQALALQGELDAAHELLYAGRDWLLHTVDHELPPDAGPGFLKLHPLNLLLAETQVGTRR